jgi:hypothetical protein
MIDHSRVILSAHPIQPPDPPQQVSYQGPAPEQTGNHATPGVTQRPTSLFAVRGETLRAFTPVILSEASLRAKSKDLTHSHGLIWEILRRFRMTEGVDEFHQIVSGGTYDGMSILGMVS